MKMITSGKVMNRPLAGGLDVKKVTLLHTQPWLTTNLTSRLDR